MNRTGVVRFLTAGACAIIIGSGIDAALHVAGAQSNRAPGRPAGSSIAGRESGGPLLLVDAITVREVSVQPVNQLTGQVEPFRVATIAAEAAERITSRPVHRGDPVQTGVILALLNQESALASLSQERHGLDQAVAARRQAESDYQRLDIETESGRRQASAQVGLALADQRRAQALAVEANAGERKTLALTRQQELHQAEEALAQARIDELLDKTELDRQAYLVNEGATARDVLDRTQAAYDKAVARRKTAEQALSLAAEGSRQEDRDAAGAQAAAAQSQVSAAAQQVERARAGLSAAESRDARLAAARRQIDGLRAQEMQAQDAVREAEIALARRTIRAPFSGRVLETSADTGDLMAAGTPIVRIGEIVRVKVTFAVPEQSRPQLHLQQAVTITADALPGRSFNGHITTLGYVADAKTRCFPIEVTVDNRNERLLPNMVARIALPLGPGSVRISIPIGSVVGRGSDSTVVYVLQQGYAHQREVRLGEVNGDDVEVTSGVRSGERIAAAPQRLTDGAAIRINTAAE